MKCLLCKQTFVETKIKKNHYVEKHRVKRNNRLFKRLFEETSVCSAGKHFKPKECLRCNKLIPNSIYKKIHNFVMHYGEGIYNIVETKPLDYEDIGEIEVYEISYDFYDLIR